ncbi:MAG: 2-hydroxyacid dehydrogenase [Hyphomicrobiaceae bacterium]|nr:2-hydroxyacid dehydrogenase [Hyphomicrobiaceae bacterium]
MRIVFHGVNAATFEPGFADLVGPGHEVVCVPDAPSAPADVEAMRSADVVVGIRLDRTHPRPETLRLYHAPAAGVDAIDRACLPAGAPLCCCYGHDPAIAEYVMTALLLRHVPIPAADRDLRQGKWTYWASSRAALRTELGDATLGIVGFGHIGKAVAERAKAFGMKVHVTNRSPVVPGGTVDRYFPLSELAAFMASADYVLVTLPHTPATERLIGAAALDAMRPTGVVLNVGRGPVIDEAALYAALKDRRIGGAIIDTWYVYPSAGDPMPHPGRLPFHTLDNCTLTPHMSGWTHGTIRRRQETIAGNIGRLERGEALVNVV